MINDMYFGLITNILNEQFEMEPIVNFARPVCVVKTTRGWIIKTTCGWIIITEQGIG